MADETANMFAFPGPIGTAVIFGQIYHTPASQMWFRLSGLADADYVDLSPWFQCVYSVHFYRNTDAAGAADTLGVQISGVVPNNCGPVLIFHNPDIDETYDFQVIGHKAMGALP